ncbi:MAG TPA: DEAD/DEAH box helicase [Nocardioidaceae bacterium]|nr:DEAD/DEAH box helicase [Nocardioidaceae bacterium]
MTLPIALLGTDMIGQARTGTGKTLAFGIPVLQRIVAPHDSDYEELAGPDKPQALIVAPTRELAIQVAGDIAIAGKRREVRSLTVYGGVAYEPQLAALKSGVDIVVGTPGRLLDLADRRVLDLSHIKVLVLDEADKMLDLGFLPDVERLLAMTPELRQTMLFSATMPSAIVSLARTHLRHPVNVRAESTTDQQTVPTTAQFIYRAHQSDKPEIVAKILQSESSGRTIVFTRTKRQAQRLADELKDRGFPTSPLHGDMAQDARERALKRFRTGKVQVLVATEVASRGIDVEAVTHVINYECPDDEKAYLHRIGRTGRAGASGVAVTLVDWADVTRWKVINNALDLPFEDATETYSTSEHLYRDLGIPPGVKGRLKDPTPTPKSESESDPDSDRRGPASKPGKNGVDKGSDRPRRRRKRRRTRAGQPVNESSA